MSDFTNHAGKLLRNRQNLRRVFAFNHDTQ
jgi:hypothetical protein